MRSLRYRNFQLFFSGQLVSLVGTWMQNVAQAWLVYRLTGSAVLLGAVGFAGQIPIFLLATVGGVVADRYSRHRVVVATQTASLLLAFALAALTLTGAVHIWHIFTLAALLGAVNAFDIPARQAFIVEMVEREDLINAIALNSSMFNGARVVGPAIAGVLVAWIGEGWCFFVNGVSYLAVIAGLLMMRLPRRAALGEPREPVLERVIEGFRFVIGNPPIHALMMLLGLVSVAGMPYAVLMPIFADQILHGGARGLGLLMGASGVGAVAAALLLAVRRGVLGLGRVVAAAAGAFGVSLIAFAYSRDFRLSLALMLPVGFSLMLQMGSSNTLIQTMTPDRLRGRVMAVYSMMFMGMAPIGALFAGVAAHRLGAPAVVAIGGAASLAGAGAFALWLPRLRPGARELIATQGIAGGDAREGVAREGTP
jgi:MFS family permease